MYITYGTYIWVIPIFDLKLILPVIMAFTCWSEAILLLLYYIRNHHLAHITKKMSKFSRRFRFPHFILRNNLMSTTKLFITSTVMWVCVSVCGLSMHAAVFHCIFIIITLHIFFHYYLTKSKTMWNFFFRLFVCCCCCWFGFFFHSSESASFRINWVIYHKEKSKRNKIRFNFSIVYFFLSFFSASDWIIFSGVLWNRLS